tara:strand:+ start:2353 stop:2571 length:219 start_codon:yes stop_codon:yes gene_type:complete
MKISALKLRKMIQEQTGYDDYDDHGDQDADDLAYKLGEAFENAEDLDPALIVRAINSALADNRVPLSVRPAR